MRIMSDKYTAIAGKLGTMVGTMNKSGMCFRTLVTPANPNTTAQQGVRGTLTTLASAWKNTLTAEQRAGWATYAATLEFTSKIGQTYSISGFNAYVMCNGARIVGGLSRIDEPPTVAGFDTFTAVVPTFDDSADEVSIAFTNTDGWAGEVGGALIVRVSPIGFSPGVTFYEGPFQYLGKQAGAATPPASPLVLDMSAIGVVEGVQYAISVRSVRADGRISKEVIFRSTAVA